VGERDGRVVVSIEATTDVAALRFEG
jgi:hypothetical protein